MGGRGEHLGYHSDAMNKTLTNTRANFVITNEMEERKKYVVSITTRPIG
jgi:hypothetical protein